MKTIPNYISLSRIVLSLILLFTTPLGTAFYILYLVCGLSDMVDGLIARKTGATSRLGEKLDSVADMTMIGVLLVMLYPVINPPVSILLWVALIGVVRVAAMAVAFKKYRVFASLHTYGNKITGFILFVFPLLLPYVHTRVLLAVICIVASLSAVEELAIQLTSSELQVNRRGLFVK